MCGHEIPIDVVQEAGLGLKTNGQAMVIMVIKNALHPQNFGLEGECVDVITSVQANRQLFSLQVQGALRTPQRSFLNVGKVNEKVFL